MSRTIARFSMAGLSVSFTVGFLVSALILAILLAGVALALGLDAGPAIVAGILAMVIHYLGSFVHHLGHSISARRSGHPMIGVRYYGVLGASQYPRDEGDLPARVHIQRALGGPVMSALITILCIVLAVLVWPTGDLLRFLAGFAVFSNAVIYTAGALFPPVTLGGFMNDGATIAHWRRRAQEEA